MTITLTAMDFNRIMSLKTISTKLDGSVKLIRIGAGRSGDDVPITVMALHGFLGVEMICVGTVDAADEERCIILNPALVEKAPKDCMTVCLRDDASDQLEITYKMLGGRSVLAAVPLDYAYKLDIHKYKSKNTSLRICVNPRYLINALSCFAKEDMVWIDVGERPVDPIWIESKDGSMNSIVMPVRP